jgi:PAS domain-containing protein
VVRDITERKIAEKRLYDERQRFSVISENAPYGLAMLDKDNRFTYINPKFKEIFGYNLIDIPDGRTWSERHILMPNIDIMFKQPGLMIMKDKTR